MTRTALIKPFAATARRIVANSLKLGVVGLSLFQFSGPARAASDQQYRNVFFSHGYGYCDARKLAKIYRTTPWQAKVIAGRKISWGNINIVRQQWRRGVNFFRKYGFSCGRSSLETERQKFAYNDAGRVANAWTGEQRHTEN